MDEFTIKSTATNIFSWKPPAYTCPKHGIVDDGNGTLQLLIGGVVISKHCMKCYQEWIAANIPEVKEIS